MGILINKNTKVVVQGITGREGSVRTKYMKSYGTHVVGGTSPGKKGSDVHGVPVYNTVKEIARAAGIVAIDAPFVAYQDIPAFERNVMEGKQMGYEGRMIIHPSQVEPSNRLYAPDPADVEWANGVVKVFEEEGLAKGKAAVSYLGKMVDTPVYLNAKDILAAQAEIDAKVKK